MEETKPKPKVKYHEWRAASRRERTRAYVEDLIGHEPPVDLSGREKLAMEQQRIWPLGLLAQRRLISPHDFWERLQRMTSNFRR